jgi:eukaryotic-like serine/threonine-protein kinase
MKNINQNYCRVLAGLILCTVLITLSYNAKSQTAMFGVNPQHTGVYISNLPSDLLLVKKWKFKTDGMIFSSAVVINDIIYFGSDDSCLYALDTTGVLKWKFKSNGIIRSTPAIKDTIAYFNNYGGTFYAINTNTGKEIWSFLTEGEKHFSMIGLFGWTPSNLLMNDPWDFYTSSPVILDTVIYFGSGLNLYALGLTSRKQLWKYAAEDVVHSTPAVTDSMIYFGCWNGKFYALNAVTGKFKWDYITGVDPSHLMQGIQSSPSIVDTIVVFGARDAKVYALNANTGSKIWSTSFGGSWMPSSYAYLNETLFTGSSEGGGLKALSIIDGSIKYSTSKNFYFTFSSPAVGSETAFIGCMNGSLFAVDVNTGKIKCRFDTDGRISDPLNAILGDGTLNPAVFNPVSGYPYEQAVEYVRRLLTAGSIPSTPVISMNVIYFGSSDSCLYAVYDTGICKPNIQVSTNTMNLGVISNSGFIDTSYYVSNISECQDSLIVYAANNTNSILKAAVEISPSAYTIESRDSVKIDVIINLSDLGNKLYKLNLINQSKTNEYQSQNTEISFKNDRESNVPEVGNKQTDVIYPNPFNDFINVKTEYGQRITLINSIGAIVLQKELKETDSQIDLSYLPSGIFLVITNSDDKLYTTKIIKN